MAEGTLKSFLLAIMRAPVRMFHHAVRQGKVLAHGCGVNVTAEIDPLAAIVRPCLTAKCFLNSSGDDRLFQSPEMFTGHKPSITFPCLAMPLFAAGGLFAVAAQSMAILENTVELISRWLLMIAALVLTELASPAKTGKDPLPPLPEATVIYGSFDPFFLTIRTPQTTVHLLPESGQAENRDNKPIYPGITRDGKQVAAGRLRGVDPRRVSISVYSIPGKKWTDYAEGTYAGSIAISPDGSRLAFPGQCNQQPVRIHVLNRATGEEILGPEVGDCGAILSWSPDARQLVFEVVTPDIPIKVWDLSSNQVRKLVSGGAPAWSPSGEWIAYFYGSKARVVHPDGTGEKTVADLPHAGFLIRRQLEFRELPVWSPDSTHLLLNVLMTEEYGMDVLIVDVASLRKHTVFRNVAPVIGWAEAR